MKKQNSEDIFLGILTLIGMLAVIGGIIYAYIWAYDGLEAGYSAVNQAQLQVVYDRLTNVEHDVDLLLKEKKK